MGKMTEALINVIFPFILHLNSSVALSKATEELIR
jgi:hypothetical protein